jgi:predicted PurR-regulated permease PerM
VIAHERVGGTLEEYAVGVVEDEFLVVVGVPGRVNRLAGGIRQQRAAPQVEVFFVRPTSAEPDECRAMGINGDLNPTKNLYLSVRMDCTRLGMKQEHSGMTVQSIARSTIVVLLILALAYVMLVSFRILIVVLLAIIIASAIRPYVIRLREWRMPETAAILLVYALIIGSFVFLILLVLPPIVSQTVRYIDNDSQLSARLIVAQDWLQRTIAEATGTQITLFDPEEIRTGVSSLVSRISRTAPNAIGEIGGYLGDVVLVVVMGIYWLTSRDRAVNFVVELFPLGYQPQIQAIFDEIEQSLGAYVRGLITVSVIVGFLNFIPMAILRVPNPAALAFIIGAATAIPVIGGLIGSVVATGLTLLVSPVNSVAVLIISIIVQQIENNVLTPRFMSQSAGLDPILTMVVVFAGFAINGVVGALISVPIAGTIYILLKYLVIEPRKARVTPQTVDGGILLSTTILNHEGDSLR